MSSEDGAPHRDKRAKHFHLPPQGLFAAESRYGEVAFRVEGRRVTFNHQHIKGHFDLPRSSADLVMQRWESLPEELMDAIGEFTDQEDVDNFESAQKDQFVPFQGVVTVKGFDKSEPLVDEKSHDELTLLPSELRMAYYHRRQHANDLNHTRDQSTPGAWVTFPDPDSFRIDCPSQPAFWLSANYHHGVEEDADRAVESFDRALDPRPRNRDHEVQLLSQVANNHDQTGNPGTARIMRLIAKYKDENKPK